MHEADILSIVRLRLGAAPLIQFCSLKPQPGVLCVERYLLDWNLTLRLAMEFQISLMLNNQGLPCTAPPHAPSVSTLEESCTKLLLLAALNFLCKAGNSLLL